MSIQETDLQLASDFRTIISRMIKKLRSKSSVTQKLSLTERSVIKLLIEYKELVPSELAAMEKITSQSMSQIVNHLFEEGYIIRKESKTDKRKVLISLTKAGQNLYYKTIHERDEWLRKAMQETLSARELEMLRKMIEPLSRLVEFE